MGERQFFANTAEAREELPNSFHCEHEVKSQFANLGVLLDCEGKDLEVYA